MKNNITNILIIVLILLTGGLYFTKNESSQSAITGTIGGSVGATFNTAKVGQVNISPTIGATTTGVLNTDATDRFIESTYYACSGVGTSQTAFTGAGLAALTLKIATGTTQAPAAITNGNTIQQTVSTSTPDSYTASTTIASMIRIWPTGTYLNFEFNATNTAACTVGAHYLAS